MAKSKQNPWLPSGGVLAVAVAAAVLAAILVNVYLSAAKRQYELASELFLQMKRDVPQGKPIEVGDVEAQRIPKPLLESGAFAKAIKAADKDSLVLKRKARRDLYAGEFLFYTDFLPGAHVPALESIPGQYEMLTIEIKPEPLLQPGAFVTVRGAFDVDPDPKREAIEFMDVMFNVQVKAVGGSAEAVEDRRREVDNIQILLKRDQVNQLLQIKAALATRRFEVAVTGTPTGARSEPQFAPAILDFIDKSKKPAIPPVAP